MGEYQPSSNSLPPAITPAFNPSAGSYTSTQSVAISNGMGNASIYYTTDGSTPTSGSTLYTGPVSVAATETISAIAIASGYPNKRYSNGSVYASGTSGHSNFQCARRKLTLDRYR